MVSESIFSIVIPFYQYKAGLLRRAVTSVLEQTFTGICNIIVVDDGSPIKAEDEISQEDIRRSNFSLKIIRQPNTGVCGARNRALSEIEKNTDVVIFLDSDDTFDAHRLETIRRAFDGGADFFFSNTQRSDSEKTAFEVNGFFQEESSDLFKKIDDGIYSYGGRFADIVFTDCPFGANSIAYRWEGREHVRYPLGYTRACEDRLFAARLLAISKTVAFSPRVDVHLGTGINIYASSVWGSEEGVVRILDTSRFHNSIEQEIDLSEQQKVTNRMFIGGLDLEFIESTLVVLFRKRKFMTKEIGQYFRRRPHAVFKVPRVLCKLVLGKVTSRFAGSRP